MSAFPVVQKQDEKKWLPSIQKGVVIDHIPPKMALPLADLLKDFVEDRFMMFAMNLRSKRMGVKDLFKVEGEWLQKDELEVIGVFCPKATVNFISEGKVVEKFKVTVPTQVKEIFLCPNSQCITNADLVHTCFIVEPYKRRVRLRCHYCEELFDHREIKRC